MLLNSMFCLITQTTNKEMRNIDSNELVVNFLVNLCIVEMGYTRSLLWNECIDFRRT